MKIKDITILFILAGLWGASFLFMRVASPVIGPFLTIELRVLIAGVALLLYTVFMRKVPNLRTHWKQYLMIGALNAALPFVLIATATIHLNASLAAILNSTTPLFTAIVSWFWLKEKLNMKKWVGIVLGIFGVILLVGWSPIPLSKEVIMSVCFSIVAAFSYGVGGIYTKLTFKGVAPMTLAIGQQLGAALLLIPFTVTQIPSMAVSTSIIYSILGLALLCTAVAYLLYFYLIENVGPTNTLSVTLLVPFFGVIWGALFLGEKITFGIIAGLAVILTSVFLISDIKVGARKIRKEKMVG
ncbi:DMT family transporter [Cytobacillus sp. FJAT-54145]|uniref:DMT family transporter n=1 Tax=Cytobacillus spartinae TaxID=3299023 RepID=A0ABW6KEY2_9BACI